MVNVFSVSQNELHDWIVLKFGEAGFVSVERILQAYLIQMA